MTFLPEILPDINLMVEIPLNKMLKAGSRESVDDTLWSGTMIDDLEFNLYSSNNKCNILSVSKECRDHWMRHLTV